MYGASPELVHRKGCTINRNNYMDRDLTINSIAFAYRGDEKGISLRRNVSAGLEKPKDMAVGSIVDSKGGRRTKLEFAFTNISATTGRAYQTRCLVQLITDYETTTAQAVEVIETATYALNMSRNAADLTAQADVATKVLINQEV